MTDRRLPLRIGRQARLGDQASRWRARVMIGGWSSSVGYRRSPSVKRITSDQFPILVVQRANDLQSRIGG